MTEHKQVRIKGYGQEAEVDEGIAPLIMEMWRCGIRTFMSCQEGAHRFVWLNFHNTREAEKFMNIVGDYEPERNSLYQRMTGRDPDNPNNWLFNTNAEDYNLDEEAEDLDEYHLGEPAFTFSLSIWFPPADLPGVIARLVAHRKAKRQRVSPALKQFLSSS